LPRVLNVDDYLDYLANRTLPDLSAEVQRALEALWSSSAVPGTERAAGHFSCAACNLGMGLPSDLNALADRVFTVVIKDFLDRWTFNVKTLMKCCVEVLVPDGRMIPFCAYNTVGYREQIRAALAAHPGAVGPGSLGPVRPPQGA
ncbi:MAG TPA: radical SAM protein, partial [Gammaproteobacteria bacterium]